MIIRSAFKNKMIQVGDNNALNGLKSVIIKARIPGVKKVKTFKYGAKKAAKLFAVTVTDPDNKKALITAADAVAGFTGTRTDITVKNSK